jgi:hypothetical protein
MGNHTSQIKALLPTDLDTLGAEQAFDPDRLSPGYASARLLFLLEQVPGQKHPGSQVRPVPEVSAACGAAGFTNVCLSGFGAASASLPRSHPQDSLTGTTPIGLETIQELRAGSAHVIAPAGSMKRAAGRSGTTK